MAYRDERVPAEQSSWTVRVVPNKYPALAPESNGGANDDGFYASVDGLGVHEVIIESPEHIDNMALLTEKQTTEVLLAYRDRMRSLGAEQRWRYILIYKNQGVPAGATLPHAHSQLIALPMVPKAVADEIAGAKEHYDTTGRCIFCATIAKEIDARERLIAADERFFVLCPYAPRFPFEVWILPRQHASCFEQGSKDDCAQLAHALRETLVRLDRQLQNPPFNYIIHSNPPAEAESPFYHWHIEILPKLTQVAGFEWGSGAYLNPVPPEEAARLLRDVAV